MRDDAERGEHLVLDFARHLGMLLEVFGRIVLALADALARYALDKLAYFKIPGWVAFLNNLPTTYSQKLRKGSATLPTSA